jgi:hypothetical protein
MCWGGWRGFYDGAFSGVLQGAGWAGAGLGVNVCNGIRAAQKSEERLWRAAVVTATIIEIKSLSY